MPRNVRNFWVTVRPDGGREYETGPRSADGGCTVLIRNRLRGQVSSDYIEVKCTVGCDGMLKIEVWAGDTLVHEAANIPR